MRVFEVIGYKLVIDDARAPQGFVRLRNQFFPIRPLRFGDVDFDHPPPRRLKVGSEPEPGPIVVYETVFCVELVEQLDYR